MTPPGLRLSFCREERCYIGNMWATEPPHGACIFCSGWHRVFEMGQISPERRSPDGRITAGTRMIVERITSSVSPSIETSPASSPRRANVTELGSAER